LQKSLLPYPIKNSFPLSKKNTVNRGNKSIALNDGEPLTNGLPQGRVKAKV
jgi:hypothetical protein